VGAKIEATCIPQKQNIPMTYTFPEAKVGLVETPCAMQIPHVQVKVVEIHFPRWLSAICHLLPPVSMVGNDFVSTCEKISPLRELARCTTEYPDNLLRKERKIKIRKQHWLAPQLLPGVCSMSGLLISFSPGQVQEYRTYGVFRPPVATHTLSTDCVIFRF
jgi:hypothetical protein